MTWRGLVWWHPSCLRRRVIVNLVAGDEGAYEGVLWAVRGEWLRLRDAQLLSPQTPPTLVDGQLVGERPKDPITLDGEIVVHRDRVLYLQVLP